jgi:outer membrane protein OmpA-like peptidoglycan-associated protein
MENPYMSAIARIFILLILICGSVISYGQELHTTNKRAIKAFNRAVEYFDGRNDEMALIFCDKAIKADKSFVEAYMMKAQILKDRGELETAIDNFEKALSIDPDFYPEGFMVLASAQFNSGNYQHALNNIQTFLKKQVFRQISKEDALAFQRRAEFAIETVNNPVPFNPVNLGDSINSDLNEYWPSLSLDGSTLYFTVMLPKDMGAKSETSGFQEDFYFSERSEDSIWRERKNAGGFLNTDKNEGAQSLSANGKVLYFTACDRMDGFGKCDIYISYNHSGNWSTPLNLGGYVNSKYSDKHPSVSSDERELYFASDRPGGFGGLDIWVVRKDRYDQWGEAVNLGEGINTPGHEQSPFIHPDNRSLYFSSEGHMNLGRGDIFLSKQDSAGNWGNPVNLGYPINTHNDEIGLIVNAAGNKAFYASDRIKERGMDIYNFDLHRDVQPIPVSYMKGRVYNSLTFRGIEAEFQLIDLESGELVVIADSNPGEGDYLVPLPVNRNYALNVSHPGYLFYSDHFELKGIFEITDPFIKDVPLKPIKSGEKIVLNNVFFEFDRADLKPESEVELNKTYEFLVNNPSVHIRIAGHTDNIGPDEYNMELSERRAEAVVNYLIEKGISTDRLEYKGFGSSQPVADNATEDGRAKNRRTELEIIDGKRR